MFSISSQLFILHNINKPSRKTCADQVEYIGPESVEQEAKEMLVTMSVTPQSSSR